MTITKEILRSKVLIWQHEEVKGRKKHQICSQYLSTEENTRAVMRVYYYHTRHVHVFINDFSSLNQPTRMYLTELHLSSNNEGAPFSFKLLGLWVRFLGPGRLIPRFCNDFADHMIFVMINTLGFQCHILFSTIFDFHLKINERYMLR